MTSELLKSKGKHKTHVEIEMEGNKEISEVKNVLPQNYSHEITSFNFSSATDFTLILRASVLTEQDSKEWIKEFSKTTFTNWIVAKTVKLQKHIYKAVYACHRSSKNKAKNPKVATGRNTDCRAEIKVLIKKVNRSTIRNDDLLKRPKPLAGKITINFKHNHDIRCGDALKLLRVTPETREAYVNYFKEGLCLAAARRAHEARLLATAAENLSNAAENPCERTVRHIYHLWQKAHQSKDTNLNTPEGHKSTTHRQPSETSVTKVEVDSADHSTRDSTVTNDLEASDSRNENTDFLTYNIDMDDNDAVDKADNDEIAEGPLASPSATDKVEEIREQIKHKWTTLERLIDTIKDHSIKHGDLKTNSGLARMIEEFSRSAENIASINKFLHTSFRS